MLKPLPTPAEIAEWDNRTIRDIGIPGLTLMESASREAVHVLLSEYGSVSGKKVFCFAGSGNNGGDAFAMARILIDLGAEVSVFHTKPKKQYRGDARTNLKWAQKLSISMVHLPSIQAPLPQPDIIIDGLLGTGFKDTLRESTRSIVREINRLGRRSFVLAIDIPSGLNGLNGVAQPEAVYANATATFQAPKLGLCLPSATKHVGCLHTCNIGIPKQIQSKHSTRHYLISDHALQSVRTPQQDMHKGTAGKVLVIGGSEGLTGAPHLTAIGALRSGAGLVTVTCPMGVCESVKANSPDIMTFPLGSGSEWEVSMAEKLLEKAPEYDSVVIGPGLGRARKTVDFLKSFVAKCPARTIIDADGLYALAQHPQLLSELRNDTILTPHPGEMAKLINSTTEEIQRNRLNVAQQFVTTCKSVLILKGAGTIVADQDVTCLSPFSEPNLSVGGSGDVLAGVIGTMLSQGHTPRDAACIGVYWHGATGRLLKKNFPARGNLALDIANSLPKAVQQEL
tara:strand:+ start:46216 stop:47745 length:1530 start_codon:yes stop_codon:yes gene_type:complete